MAATNRSRECTSETAQDEMPGAVLVGTYNGQAAIQNSRRNFTPALMIDEHIVADHSEMELALHSHFSGVFGSAPRGGGGGTRWTSGLLASSTSTWRTRICHSLPWKPERPSRHYRATGLRDLTNSLAPSTNQPGPPSKVPNRSHGGHMRIRAR